jgi:aromatic ring-opening dioxygenase catalytic subunit (LigB family)
MSASTEPLPTTVFAGAHWEVTGDKIEVAMNPNPQKTPVAYVAPKRYQNFKLNADLEGGERCIQLLHKAGCNVSANPSFDFIHDTFLIIIRMFPNSTTAKPHPPATIISMNALFDPHYHVKIGSALRPLRYKDTLIIGSGGAVHNLYRNHWTNITLYRDNLAMPQPPAEWALEFRQAVEDAFTMNSGPELRRAMTRLMKHPRYREAHGTDDHFMAVMFVAGAAGDVEDQGTKNVMKAECWELVNMCNTQFQLGEWY